MERYDLIVVGGGASGLMAARRAGVFAKKRGEPLSIRVVEGNPKPGNKLLATGTGRCNLTNLHIAASRYHGDREAAGRLLARYPAGRSLKEFEAMGLLTRADEEGRVYPRSLQAAAVLQALRYGCEEAGAAIRCDFPVTSVAPASEGGFLLKSETGGALRAGHCVLALGGKASPRHSCGDYREALLKGLGHSFLPCFPALAPVKSASKLLKPLKGMRCRTRATLLKSGCPVFSERGEVLFGERTLSGICMFNLSSHLVHEDLSRLEISLDLAEELEAGALEEYLKRFCRDHGTLPASELFSGILNLRVGQAVGKSLGISGMAPLKSLPPQLLRQAARLVKDLRFDVKGPASFENAQITAGGVPLEEVDPRTLESKKRPGLYLAGELLNVNGDCGGYNLQWAWATGICAGENAAAALLRNHS